jgi:flagellar hook-associated protein 1 FlgK
MWGFIMSISSLSLFESARKGLNANQLALTVVSQNVANASTDGYTRQEVLLKNTAPVSYSLNMQSSTIGTGVEVGEVRQVRDSYIDAQIRLQNEVSSYWGETQTYLERIQTFLTDNSDAGLRGLMDDFWKAAEDVSNSPQSQTTRLAMIQAGDALVSGVRYAAAQIDEVQKAANGTISEKVDRLNILAKRIAETNGQIAKFEKADFKMNDLRDERARLIKELSALASISVSRSGDLDDAVISLNGRALVNGSEYGQIETVPDTNGNLGLRWKGDESGTSTNPAIADAIISPNAAGGIYELNVKSLAEGFTVFSKSYDLDKNSLLSTLGVTSGNISVNGVELMIDAQKTTLSGLVKMINQSAAGVTAEIDSGGKIALRSLETGAASRISLADAGSNFFEKTGLISAVSGRPLPAVTSADESLNISGSFTVNGVRISIEQGQTDSLARMASEINSMSKDVAAAVVKGPDGVYTLKLTAREGYSKIEIEDRADNLLNRLGLLRSPQTKLTVDGVSAEGGKDAIFTINNTEYTSATNTVKSAVAGIEFRLNGEGAAQIDARPVLKGGAIGALLSVRDETAPGYLAEIAGFVKTFASEFNAVHSSGFDLSGATGRNFFDAVNFPSSASASKIIDGFAVSGEIRNDPSKFAAAGRDEDYYSQTGVIRGMGGADNTTALKFTELKSKAVFGDGSTITEKYSEIVFRIGSEVEAAQQMNKTQKTILANLELKKESVSGVSLDEEISNMMKFQHAYNASARMINVVDEMLDTIINGLMR